MRTEAADGEANESGGVESGGSAWDRGGLGRDGAGKLFATRSARTLAKRRYFAAEVAVGIWALSRLLDSRPNGTRDRPVCDRISCGPDHPSRAGCAAGCDGQPHEAVADDNRERGGSRSTEAADGDRLYGMSTAPHRCGRGRGHVRRTANHDGLARDAHGPASLNPQQQEAVSVPSGASFSAPPSDTPGRNPHP
jgi:hypothetical protein